MHHFCLAPRSLSPSAMQERFQSGSFTVRAIAKDADSLKSCKEKHLQLQTAEFNFDNPATYDAVLKGTTTVFLVNKQPTHLTTSTAFFSAVLSLFAFCHVLSFC